MPAMTRVGQGVYAASNARRKWLTSDPTGVNLSGSKSAANGAPTNSKTYRSSDNAARIEQLSKALSIGFGSVDALLPRHAATRNAVVDLAGPSYENRFTQLPDGLSAARAAIAIAAVWGSIELRRCQENRLSTKQDSTFASTQKKEVRESSNQMQLDTKQAKIGSSFRDTSAAVVSLPKAPSTINAASGSNLNGERSNAVILIPRMFIEEQSAFDWFKYVNSSLSETTLLDGLLHSAIQTLSSLIPEASTGEIPLMSIYSSPSLFGACFRRAPSQPNRTAPMNSKQIASPKLRSVPRAAILAQVNTRPSLNSRARENEKNPDHKNITPTTPISTRPAGVSSDTSRPDFEMKVPNLDLTMDPEATEREIKEVSEKPLTMGYKTRLAAPHMHWNKLLKSLEAKEEEVEEATGVAKKTNLSKSPTPLSAHLIRRKQKLEQRVLSRRRLQTKAQSISGVKRSSSNSGIASSSLRSSASKTLSSSRRPQRKARLANPIRDWSSAELSSEGDGFQSPSRGVTAKKLFQQDNGGTTQSSHGTLSNGSRQIIKERVGRPISERKPGIVRKVMSNDDALVSGWVLQKFTTLLPLSTDVTIDVMSNLDATDRDYSESIFQKVASSSKNRTQSSMFAVSEISDDSQSSIVIQELSKSLGRGSKIDVLKSTQLDLSALNKFISSSGVAGSRFVGSLASGDDSNPSTRVPTTKRNGVRTEIAVQEEKESAFGTGDGNPTKNESLYTTPSKAMVETENIDDESEETKAAGLQQRVCGSLFESMTPTDQEKVKRWALRNFSDFVGTEDIMEVTLNVKSVECSRCGPTESVEGMCEESIVLKLWKDMTWRKVRRLRHVLGSDA